MKIQNGIFIISNLCSAAISGNKNTFGFTGIAENKNVEFKDFSMAVNRGISE